MSTHNITWMTEFTSKYHKSQKKGTTPSNFVTDYISRPDATETLDPVLLNPINKPTKVFLQQLQSDNVTLAKAIHEYASNQDTQQWFQKQNQNLDGRAFGNLNNSYTEVELRQQAKRVQELYDNGHSVLKMVTSFRTPYLQQQNVIEPNFKHLQQGDFFGNVDELKLRQVMNNTLAHVSSTSDFSNPLWMSGIQLDKDHVHCHTVLVDDIPLNQSKRLVPANHQKSDVNYYHLEDRGELSQYQLNDAKRYCDFQFGQYRGLSFMKNNPEKLKTKFKEEQQVVDSQHLLTNAKLQTLLVTLPTDKTQWTMQNQNVAMQRPNAIMHEYINDLATNYGHQFGYQNVQKLIEQRSQRLPENQRQSYVDNANQQLTNNLGNYVYRDLQQTTDDQLNLTTPYLRTQALDDNELRKVIQNSVAGQGQLENPQLTMFNFRTQAYNKRLDYHQQQRQTYQQLTRQFDNTEHVSDEAYHLRDFYQAATKYHTQATDKYRYQLHTQGDSGEYALLQQQIPQIEQQREFVNSMYNLQGKPELKPMPQVDKLLALNSAQTVLNTSVNNNQTLGDVLKAQHDDYQSLSPKMLKMLSQLDSAPQLKGVYDESYRNSNNFLNENLQQNDYLNDYQTQVRSFTDRAYDAGLIDASDWQKVQSTTMPELPTLRLGTSVDKAQYDNVKGVDLEDCVDDLSPLDSRHVSHKVVDEHQDATDELADTMTKAMTYLRDTQQLNDEILQIANQLAYRRKLEKYMRQHNQLPNGRLTTQDVGNPQIQRNLRTMDLTTASDQTHALVQDLSQPVSEFELQHLDTDADLELN